MDETDIIKTAKMTIAKMEKENINVNQFFPVLKHNFQKASTTEASNIWHGLVSSVSGKLKKPRPLQSSPETSTSKTTATEVASILVPSQSEEEEKNSTFDELRIFSRNNSPEDFVVSTELSQAMQYNYDQEGYFETAPNIEKYSFNIIRSQSILDPFVWLTYKEKLEEMLNAKKFTVQHTSLSLIAKAKLDQQNGNQMASFRKYNKIVALNPNNPFCLTDRAEISVHLGDLQSAIYDYGRAFHLFQSSFVLKFRLAKLYCLQGQLYLDMEMYNDALQAFIKASALVPDQIAYKAKCCSCLVNLKCFDQAWVILNTLLNQYPNNMDLILMSARLYHITGDYSNSFQCLKVVLNQGDHPIASQMLRQIISQANQFKYEAITLNVQKQFYPAIKKINLAIRLYPTESKFYLLRGILHRHVEDFNSSIDDLVMAINKSDLEEKENIQKKAEHQLLLTFNDFSLECFAKGFVDEAIQLLNRAISGEKNEKGLYLNRAECFYHKKKYNFSLQDYQQALELDPNDFEILPKIASVYYKMGMEEYIQRDYEKAIKTLTLAIEHAPTMGRYYITRCKCFQMLRNLYLAKADLLIGMQLEPTNREIVPLLAYLFPSTSIPDILAHPLAILAKQVVQNLLNGPKYKQPPPLTNQQSNQKEENYIHNSSLKTNKELSSLFSQTSTLSNKSISTKNLVWQKKKINNKILDTLKNPKSLRSLDKNEDLKRSGLNQNISSKTGQSSTWQKTILKGR